MGGSVVDMPKSDELCQAYAGLGWDTHMGEVDLDVSAVLLDRNAREIDCCFFGNEEAQGIKHSGDNLTGEGKGDDEVITMDLQALAAEVEQIVFVINIYTKGKTFSQVANPYRRLFSRSGDEMCRYQLQEAGSEEALVIARLFREPGACRWGFQAIGQPCKGRTYKDSLPAVVKYAKARPQDLAMTRSCSSMSVGGDASVRAQPILEPVIEGVVRENECGC